MENAKLRIKDLYYHKKCLIESGEASEAREIREMGGEAVGTEIYCKRCQTKVQPVKEQKTLGKSVTNFLSAIFFRAPVYTYPRRCPNCGKVLRTRGQLGFGILFIVFVLIISIVILIVRN
ncbi:MAG: hypothetical protein ACFE8N_12535 [Promethearchaeota archaeon]